MFELGSNNPQWVMIGSFSSYPDFCIWVLAIDGLRVPPFTHHPEGNQKLRDAGMSAESWFTWFTRVILLEDHRLGWDEQERQRVKLRMEQELPRYEDVAAVAEAEFPGLPLQPFETGRLTVQDQAYLDWQKSHYEQALAAASQFFGDELLPHPSTSPPELWRGEMAVQAILKEMWTFYRSNVSHQREQQFIDNEQSYSSSSAYARLAPPRSPVAALELYLIAYPELVELIIPPASVVLSVRTAQSQPALTGRVIQASERLVELNNSL
jgi:hypothetical protein